MNIQCDHVIEARRPNIVIVNKQERKCTIIDIAVPADKKAKRRMGKLKSIMSIKRNCKNGEHGNCAGVTKNLDMWLGKLDVKISISLLQKNCVTSNSKDFEKSIRALE